VEAEMALGEYMEMQEPDLYHYRIFTTCAKMEQMYQFG
jgi:hypothetical protein